MTRRVGAVAAVFLVTLAVREQYRTGKYPCRFDTFGDEQLWTTTLQMHTVVPKLTPRAALGLGLKVDVEALPLSVITALKADPTLLDNAAVTLQLLRLNAVVGLIGRFGPDDTQIGRAHV